MSRLWTHPQVIALLLSAKEAPEDDAPRLVLADWLEDHGEDDRAEFIRAQLTLAPGSPDSDATSSQPLRQRTDRLLDENGGCWLGPLWRYWLSPSSWHRGLLSVGLPPRVIPEPIDAALAWIGVLVWQASGHRSFSRLGRLVELAAPNHLSVDLRRPVREDRLIEHLSFACDSPCLRTLSFEWPVGLIHKEDGQRFACYPDVTCDFLAQLLTDTSLCRRLTHLSSNPGWSPGQVTFIRSLGVEPIRTDGRLWMHALPACHFRERSTTTKEGP